MENILQRALDALEDVDPSNPDTWREFAATMRAVSDDTYRAIKTVPRSKPQTIEIPTHDRCEHVQLPDDAPQAIVDLVFGSRSWSTANGAQSLDKARRYLRGLGLTISKRYVGRCVVGVIKCGVCSGEAPYGRDAKGRPLELHKGGLWTADGEHLGPWEGPQGGA